jgi:ketosteroid isomerase-like protein
MIEEVDENNPHEQQKIAQRIRKLVQENFDQFEINIKFTQIDLKENNDAYSLIQEVKRILTNQ